jgi:branched-subunit amino acid transport protein
VNAALIVVTAGLGSYALRASMVMVAAHAGVPKVFARVSRYTVPVAFAALAASALAGARPGDHPGPVAAVVAMTAAVIAVRRFRSPLAALPAGLPVLWIFSALGW